MSGYGLGGSLGIIEGAVLPAAHLKDPMFSAGMLPKRENSKAGAQNVSHLEIVL